MFVCVCVRAFIYIGSLSIYVYINLSIYFVYLKNNVSVYLFIFSLRILSPLFLLLCVLIHLWDVQERSHI